MTPINLDPAQVNGKLPQPPLIPVKPGGSHRRMQDDGSLADIVTSSDLIRYLSDQY